MTFNKDYLSDEELNALIAETESEGLVQAPKGLHAEVIKRIDENPAASQKERQAAFYKFTYKVVLSVAAALLLMTLLPRTIDTRRPVPTKEEVLRERAITDEIHILPQKQKLTKDEIQKSLNRKDLITMLEDYITEKGGILK